MTGPAGNPGTATGDGQQRAGHRGRATGLAGSGAPRLLTDLGVDVGPASIGAELDSAHEVPHIETRGEHFPFFNNLRAAEDRVHLNNLR